MNTRNTLLATTLAIAFATLSSSAQEPDVEILPPGQEPPERAQAQDPQQRMRELFGKIERQLESIDILLSDAAAGDTSSIAELEDAGIGRLLRDTVETGRQAQRDIEEIIDIAQQMGQQQPSSSGGGQPQDAGEPQGSPTSQGQQTQQSGEQTPSMPEQTPGGQQQGEQEGQEGEDQEQPGGEKPGEGDEKPGEGGKPDSPLGSEEDGSNRDGDDPESADGSRAAGGDPGDTGWGNLPQHVRDTFRAEGRGDLPARYRDWIDSYYHKLNRRSSSDR